MKDEYVRKAKVLHVVDGDTFDVAIDLGFNIAIKERVRVYGINCPESRSSDAGEKKAGIAAQDFALDVLASPNPGTERPLGFGRPLVFQDVMLKTVKSNEKFGRYLATVTLCDGSDFGTLMIQHGHAKEYFGGKRE